jgi:hypothetical protein
MSILEGPFKPFKMEDLSIGELEQKHFLESNGMLHTDYKDETCFCKHRKSQHLDCNDVCLSPKCICDGFRNGRQSIF